MRGKRTVHECLVKTLQNPTKQGYGASNGAQRPQANDGYPTAL